MLIFLLSQIDCQNQQITLASSENIKLPIKTISVVQFDSAFRYFMDDCGACSPEPRGKYLPAKNIQQDFVKEYYLETEKWIPETFEKLKKEDLPELKSEYSDRFLSYVVGLFYLGNERKAWKTFDKYYIGFDDKKKSEPKLNSD